MTLVYKAFSIFDTKAETYSPPFFQATDGLALRVFSELANDLGSNIGKYPEDFVLYGIGTFDATKGVIEAAPPTMLGKGIEYVKTQEPLPLDPALRTIDSRS